MGLNIFADLQKTLDDIVDTRLNPIAQQRIQSIELQQEQSLRGKALRNLVENSNVDPNDPSTLTNFLKNAAALDERFLQAFTGAAKLERDFNQAQDTRAEREGAVSELSEQLEPDAPASATALSALNLGAIDSATFRTIFQEEFKDPQKVQGQLTAAQTANLRQVYTGESINQFAQTRDATKLQFNDEFLTKLTRSAGKGRSPLGAKVTDTQAKAIAKEFKKRIEDNPIFQKLEDQKGIDFFSDQDVTLEAIAANEDRPEIQNAIATIALEAPQLMKEIQVFAIFSRRLDAANNVLQNRDSFGGINIDDLVPGAKITGTPQSLEDGDNADIEAKKARARELLNKMSQSLKQDGQ